ncbi:MAG: helix-turn-helix domain-containing protein [Bdellovibrionales bacterium]
MSKNQKEPRWVDNLRLLMEARSLSARRLSLMAGLGATAVRDILDGRAKFPRYDTVEALAGVLEVTPAQLMGSPNASISVPNDPLQDDDLNLLTEIITRLQEIIEERKQVLAPQDFAAMTTSLYRQIRDDEKSPNNLDDADISSHIDQLVSYEALRRRAVK